MAEIHVEPRKHSSNTSWIWIVLILVIVAAVVVYLLTRNNDVSSTIQSTDTTAYINHSLQWLDHKLL